MQAAVHISLATNSDYVDEGQAEASRPERRIFTQMFMISQCMRGFIHTPATLILDDMTQDGFYFTSFPVLPKTVRALIARP